MRSLAQLLNPATISVEFYNDHKGESSSIPLGTKPSAKLPVYHTGDSVCGAIKIHIPHHGKSCSHKGIRIELRGAIEIFCDELNPIIFNYMSTEIDAGVIERTTKYDFNFDDVVMPYETYEGYNARIKYFIKAVMTRTVTDIVGAAPFYVKSSVELPLFSRSLILTVGVQGSVNIEIEFNKTAYEVSEVVMGRITFRLVQSRLRRMDLSLVRTETVVSKYQNYSFAHTLIDYELMDGRPTKGQTIPVRFFLEPLNLTPSISNAEQHLSVEYSLKLCLYDDHDRKYYKSENLKVYRLREKS